MKIFMASLGCDKNLVDSEEMLGLLAAEGFSVTDDEKEAEVIIVNTCAFIGDAKEESIRTILELSAFKKEAGNGGKCLALLVTGCLAERYHAEFKKELPEVDAVVGTGAWDRIVPAVKECLAGKSTEMLSKDHHIIPPTGRRMLSTGGHFAYLKIAEGCDKRCTYCIIPTLRGRYRSVPLEELTAEAERLAKQGVKELILVAQETTVYGVDLYGEKALPRLLRELSRIDGIRWIRLMYCYPEEITDELIDTIRTEPKLCHYLDIPIQHASDEILGRMGRRTDQKSICSLIGKLRERIPDIVLRTTLMTGFPGETEEDFETLADFVNEMEFDRLGVFAYSAEEGTKAAQMSGQIPDEVKEKRREEIMLLQQEIAYDLNRERIGKQMTVFIEGKLTEEDTFVGRTYMDAPEVDGLIFLPAESSAREWISGDFAEVLVTDAKGYDLIGEFIDESAK